MSIPKRLKPFRRQRVLSRMPIFRATPTKLWSARPLGTRRVDILRAGPLFRQTDFCDTQDPRPRFGKHVLGLRLSATPSNHAFRPRLSHAFQPRLSATPSGHVFRRAIRIEDVVLLSQQCFKQTNHCRTVSAPSQDGAHHLVSEGRQNVLTGHGHASEHLLSGLEIVACLNVVSVPHAKNSSNHQRRKDQRFSQLDLPTSQY